MSSAAQLPGVESCWNRIGVWGNEKPRCPLLDDVVHCRNCQVYSDSGRQILERKLPEGYLDEWTQVLANQKEEVNPDFKTAIAFRIGDEWLALSSSLVQEITEIKRIHHVPHRCGGILSGLVNIRGELQLCVSFGSLLDIDKGTHTEDEFRRRIHQRMIVIGKEGEQFVFPTSEVLGTHRYHPDELENVPATISQAKATYTTGILKHGDKHIARLDDELLFYTLNKSLA